MAWQDITMLLRGSFRQWPLSFSFVYSFFPPHCYGCLWSLLLFLYICCQLHMCPSVLVWKPKVHKGMSSLVSSPHYLWDNVYHIARSSLLRLEWLANELLCSSHLCSLALGFWIHPNAQHFCGCWRSELRSCLPSPFVLTFKIICSIP